MNFGQFFFGRKVWSSSEISIIQFSSGGLFKTKEPFWNFVCLLMPWFNPICVDLCKYAYELVEKTFLSYDFGKGQYTFYPVKLSRFLEKNKVRRKYQKNYIRGSLTNRVKRLFDEQKFQKSKTFLEGSGHPNFMNPFVYDKSLLGKSFPKRIGALALPKPKDI